MSIHEKLPEAREELNEVGWANRLEPTKLAKKEKKQFKSAIWLHAAREMATDQFRVAIDRNSWIHAIGAAALMLGSDQSVCTVGNELLGLPGGGN